MFLLSKHFGISASILLIILCTQLAYSFPYPMDPDKEQLKLYYHFIDPLVHLPLEEQINALKDYIEESPASDRAYHKLLECYTVANKDEEAEEYFRGLAATLSFKGNSYWMLAKIADRRNLPEETFAAYLQASSSGRMPLEFQEDFIEFDLREKGRFKADSILTAHNPDPLSQKIIHILSVYYRRQYKKTINEIELLPDSISQHPLLMHIRGRCYYRQHQYDSADSLWQTGLQISRNLNDWEAESRALTTLAVLAAVRYDYKKAVSYFDSAYVVANRSKDLNRLQYIAGNWGQMLGNQGKYIKAVEKSREAIGICEQLRNHRQLATWYSVHAQVLYSLENYDEALKIYDKSEKLAVEQNQVEQQVRIKMNRGNIYHFLNLIDLARNEYQNAYELAGAYNFRYHQSDARVKIAEVLLAEGKYARARQICREYIAAQEPEDNLVWQAYYTNLIGQAYFREGQWEQALAEFLQSLKIAKKAGDPYYIASYIKDIANVKNKMNDWQAATSNYHSVLEYAEPAEDNELLIDAYFGLGNAYKKSGNVTQAVSYYKKSVRVIEDERRSLKASQMRIGYFSRRTPVYQKLVDCYLEYYQQSPALSHLDSIYYYSELARGRSLLDARIRKKVANISEDNPLYREYRSLCEQLRSLQRKLRLNALKDDTSEQDELRARLEITRHSLIAQRLLLGGSEADSSGATQDEAILSLRELIEHLKKTEMGLLFYNTSRENPFVLVVSGGETRIIHLPASRNQIEKAIHDLMIPFHRLENSTIETTLFKAELAYQLYNWLVKPARDSLDLPEKLFVVSDLSLVNLPFELLLMYSPEKPDYTPADLPTYADYFLQNSHCITYIPNTRILQNLKPAPMFAGTSLLAFANPFNFDIMLGGMAGNLRNANDWYFPPLPHADEEVNNIQRFHSSARVFRQEKATKRAFLREAPKNQILHIATHGKIDTVFESFTGLILAMDNDSSDDGCLMGYELPEVNLDCDLITLSACETGRGKLVSGEGVLGLPRLFLGAGAKSVLMTLWKVDDRFTSLLMPEFYNQFLKNDLSKADALATAKRMMLKKINENSEVHYQHPLYWAPFVLYGDAGNERAGLPIYFWALLSLFILFLVSLGIYWSRRRTRV